MKDDETQLCNIDPDDIDDVIINIENSFDFKFIQKDLDGVNNFGQFCDAVLLKINLPHMDGCSSQQAFYKLRDAINHITGISKNHITPSSKLGDIFLKEKRRKAMKQVDEYLGFATKMLEPKLSLVILIRCCLLLSVGIIFINWKIGILAVSCLYSCLELTVHFGNEFKTDTLGQAAKHILNENYKKARRNAEAINEKEVTGKIKETFMNWFNLSEKVLTRDASFNWH